MATWQYDETKLLLQLWADRNVQEQPSSSGRNKPLWDNLSKEMKNPGLDRTGTQYKTKFTTSHKDIRRKRGCEPNGTGTFGLDVL